MSKDTQQVEHTFPQGDKQLIKEIETALRERVQWVVANDPQCCELQGALNYATGKYRLKQNDEPNGAGE
jgi:hypothetical protein